LSYFGYLLDEIPGKGRSKPYNIVTTKLFAVREGITIMVDYLVSIYE